MTSPLHEIWLLIKGQERFGGICTDDLWRTLRRHGLYGRPSRATLDEWLQQLEAGGHIMRLSASKAGPDDFTWRYRPLLPAVPSPRVASDPAALPEIHSPRLR